MKSKPTGRQPTSQGVAQREIDEVEAWFRGCETQEERDRLLLAGAILRLRRKLLKETREREGS